MSKYRQLLTDSRTLDLTETQGKVLVDKSPFGHGKTSADVVLAARTNSTLTLLPSHQQVAEYWQSMIAAGVPAVRYPMLTPIDLPDLGIEKTCTQFKLANTALNIGLTPSQTVCPRCDDKEGCVYRNQTQEAKAAKHAIGTHSRAIYQLREMVDKRPLVLIQESATGILRHRMTAGESGWGTLRAVVAGAESYVTGSTKFGRESEECRFLFRMLSHIDVIRQELLKFGEGDRYVDVLSRATGIEMGADEMKALSPDLTSSVQRLLYNAAKYAGLHPKKEQMQIGLASTAGRIDGSMHFYDAKKGRRVAALIRNFLPPACTAVISDATASVSELRALTKREVVDITPDAKVEQIHQVIQITRDVTQQTIVGILEKRLRECFDCFPDSRRAGIITFKKHVEPLKEHLPADILDRVARWSWFRGTDSRGSNAFIKECDLLIVLGTYRPADEEKRDQLRLMGFDRALDRDPQWTNAKKADSEKPSQNYGLYWHGTMENG